MFLFLFAGFFGYKLYEAVTLESRVETGIRWNLDKSFDFFFVFFFTVIPI